MEFYRKSFSLDAMNDIRLAMKDQGRGAFVIEEGDERLAEMEIGIKGNNITVYHTEVSDKLKGQGAGKQLLTTLVEYARKNHQKIIPLCPFVSAQFKRHPEEYHDVWNQDWHTTHPE